MKHYYCLISIIACSVCLIGCKSTKDAPVVKTDDTEVAAPVKVLGTNSVNYIPKAVIYKTNGDYNDHVMVNLTPSRNAIASYPAPSDVSASSAALPIGDGWLLDRRGGIGPNSAFLTYTYSEYADLKSTPSPKALMECIIPDAKVTQVRTLPITVSEALADPEVLTKYIR